MPNYLRGLLDMVAGNPNANLLGVDTSMDAVRGRQQNLLGAYEAIKTQPAPYSPQEFWRRANAGEAQDPRYWDNALAVAGMTAPVGIKAYHGSPYDFDAFDASKIGTGEGAQAYGHGLYFAENPNVAESYQTSNSSTANIHYDGKPITDELERSVAWHLVRNGGDKNAVVEQWQRQYKPSYFEQGKPGAEELQILNRMDPAKLRPGHMYEVQIKADPNTFLDWDKPLNEQSPHVQEALAKNGISYDKAANQKFDDALLSALLDNGPATLPKQPPSLLGSDIYSSLSYRAKPVGFDENGRALYDAMTALNGRNPVSASDSLSKAGIPGIKYLDQGSRGAGEGSRNYVVFDPQTIEILRKYGLLGPMAGLGLLGNDDGVK